MNANEREYSTLSCLRSFAFIRGQFDVVMQS
jgi:hypothetical protein